MYFPAQSRYSNKWAVNIKTGGGQLTNLKNNDPSFKDDTAGAVMFTVQKTNSPSSQNDYLFSMTSNDNGGVNSYLYIHAMDITTTSYKFRVIYRRATSGFSNVLLSTSYLNNSINRVCLTSEMKLYINGVMVVSGSSGWFGSLLGSSPKLFTVGGYRTKNDPNNTSNAIINTFLVLNSVPTLTEIQADAITTNWHNETYASKVVSAYEFELDLNDSVGSNSLSPTKGTIGPSNFVPAI